MRESEETSLTASSSNTKITLSLPAGTRVFQELEAPRFNDNWSMKVVRLSALSAQPPLPPPGNVLVTLFC